MKKLFVLFLLVALVPFSVGCSLWGHDEDRDVLATKVITLAKVFPADLLPTTESLRAAIALKWEMLFITVNGQRLSHIDHLPTVDGMKVFFQAALPVAAVETIVNSPTVPVVVYIEPVSGSEVVVVPLTNESVPPAAATEVAPSSPTTNTSIPTDTVASTEISATVETDVQTAIGTETIGAAIEVASITFAGADVSIASTTPTQITASASYTFTVKLSETIPATITTPTWTVEVQDTADNTAKKLTNATKPSPIAVTYSGDTMTIVVTPTATYPMNAGKTFKIALTATNVKNAYGVILPVARYITIQ